jgi:hypothetical protein
MDHGLEPAQAGSSPSLFRYEVRRDGRVVATLEGRQSSAGTVVETAVFPLSRAHDEAGLTRPFTFGSTEHARRFVDEALVAFEYLNCSVA